MIILRQKYYSLGSDLKYSGIKRTIAKYVGRGRKQLAGRIGNSIRRNRDLARKAGIDSREISKRIIRPDVEKKLTNIAEESGAHVVFDGIQPANIPHSIAETTNFVNFLGEASGNIANREANIGKDIILYPRESGTGSLAHEIGHTRRGKDSIFRKITLSKNPRRGLVMAVRGDRDMSTGAIESLKRALDSTSLTIEEILANREAIKILKKSGISKSDLEKIKESYKLAENNYKNSSRAYYKMPIYNKIQIPSRRGTV